MKKFATIAGLIVTLSVIITLLFGIDARYAKSEKLEFVELRLDEKIQRDRINSLQERIWRLEDRYGCEKAKTMDEYRRLEREKITSEKQLGKESK